MNTEGDRCTRESGERNSKIKKMREKRRTGRLRGVCSGFVRAIFEFVAVIRTVRMAVAPVDTLDALVPREAFELGGCAFPFCFVS